MPGLLPEAMSANPFQILTLIVAPAILTNASSVLSLSTSNRFGRAVDRSRYLYNQLKHPETLSDLERSLYHIQLQVIGRRSQLLVKALTFFYISVGAFAATAFTSILGAAVSLFDIRYASATAEVLAMCCGVLGVIGLVSGTSMLVREMWLALSYLQSEIKLSEGIQVSPII